MTMSGIAVTAALQECPDMSGLVLAAWATPPSAEAAATVDAWLADAARNGGGGGGNGAARARAPVLARRPTLGKSGCGIVAVEEIRAGTEVMRSAPLALHAAGAALEEMCATCGSAFGGARRGLRCGRCRGPRYCDAAYVEGERCSWCGGRRAHDRPMLLLRLRRWLRLRVGSGRTGARHGTGRTGTRCCAGTARRCRPTPRCSSGSRRARPPTNASCLPPAHCWRCSRPSSQPPATLPLCARPSTPSERVRRRAFSRPLARAIARRTDPPAAGPEPDRRAPQTAATQRRARRRCTSCSGSLRATTLTSLTSSCCRGRPACTRSAPFSTTRAPPTSASPSRAASR